VAAPISLVGLGEAYTKIDVVQCVHAVGASEKPLLCYSIYKCCEISPGDGANLCPVELCIDHVIFGLMHTRDGRDHPNLDDIQDMRLPPILISTFF